MFLMTLSSTTYLHKKVIIAEDLTRCLAPISQIVLRVWSAFLILSSRLESQVLETFARSSIPKPNQKQWDLPKSIHMPFSKNTSWVVVSAPCTLEWTFQPSHQEMVNVLQLMNKKPNSADFTKCTRATKEIFHTATGRDSSNTTTSGDTSSSMVSLTQWRDHQLRESSISLSSCKLWPRLLSNHLPMTVASTLKRARISQETPALSMNALLIEVLRVKSLRKLPTHTFRNSRVVVMAAEHTPEQLTLRRAEHTRRLSPTQSCSNLKPTQNGQFHYQTLDS